MWFIDAREVEGDQALGGLTASKTKCASGIIPIVHHGNVSTVSESCQ